MSDAFADLAPSNTSPHEPNRSADADAHPSLSLPDTPTPATPTPDASTPEDRAAATQREVILGLTPFVQANLDLLVPPEKSWQPSDYLPDFSQDDWHERLTRLREPAMEMDDELLVVLVGDMVTEEALPSYSVALNTIVDDQEGTSDAPWAQWLRGWTAEENRHGDLLNAYLRLTGRVDMRAVEFTVQHLLSTGFSSRSRGNLYGGLVYTSFQERATRISHNGVAKLAARGGNAALGEICRRIAGDEARHETFYTRMMGAILDQDPDGGMQTVGTMLRRTIAMPGRLMFDGKDPDLFDHFSIVAQRIGVYTVRDYASIVRHLVRVWGIADRQVSGRAARAQEFLCRHAELLETLADQVELRISGEPSVPFAWIHGRLA